MKPIGGFCELEIPRGCGPYHVDAIALTSGRACLRHLLCRLQPARVFVPFHACDALLEPISALGIPFEWYAIDERLEPRPALRPRAGEAAIYVNYYGVKGDAARRLANELGAMIIIDDTQGFFEQGYPGSFSFNSARKFFGVPDGAYLYTSISLPAVTSRNEVPSWEHLTARLMGHQEEAYRCFVEAEARIDSEVRGMSLGAERLLAGIDYARAADRRRANFAAYHAALGSLNDLPLAPDPAVAPMCYPFLPRRELAREALYAQGIYLPTYWKDCIRRMEPGFAWERDLAARLAPLPIDHRYDGGDIARVIRAIHELLGA